MKPNFFIVGAPKCGTTAMNHYLSGHADIFMAAKELHFFGSDLKMKNRISEKEYMRCFEAAGNEKKIWGEASVWYLFSQHAAAEIKEFSPEAKVLIMLRNPLEMIYSLHSQNIYDGNEDVLDFETALALDENRKKGIDLPRAVDFWNLPGYIDAVQFSRQVKRYLDVFGKKNVHIILYEDFVADTPKVVSELLQFLEVDPHIDMEFKIVNPNKAVRNFFLHRMIKYPLPGLKKIVRLVLPFRRLRHGIMSFFYNSNITIRTRKKMDVRLRAKLKDILAEDVDRLGKMISRDLSFWMK